MEGLKIQEGRYYLQRDGVLVGPMHVPERTGLTYPVQYKGEGWTDDGYFLSSRQECSADLVAEFNPYDVMVGGGGGSGEPVDLKYDSGKLQFSCLTRGLAVPLRAVAAVLTYGAEKYKKDSWKTVQHARSRYEDALDRHLNAWKAGEQNDPESGMLHLAHIACNALFLLWFEIKDTGTDVTKYNNPKGN